MATIAGHILAGAEGISGQTVHELVLQDVAHRAEEPQQIAAILYRYAGSPDADAVDMSVYADADSVQAYAAGAMNWAIANSLIKGDNNGNCF